MSIVVDLIIIAILLMSILISCFKGVSSVIYQILSWAVTVVLIFALSAPIANFLMDKTKLDETISNKIETSLRNSYGSDLEEGNEIKEENSNISTTFLNVINKYIREAKNQGIQNISNYVSNKITYSVINAISILIIFIVARFISILIKFVIEIIASLPLLNTVNKLGGIVFGAVRGLIIVYVLLGVLSLLSPALANTEIIAAIKSSYIASIFYNNNIILNYIINR